MLLRMFILLIFHFRDCLHLGKRVLGKKRAYQFWSQADENGIFSIANVFPNNYNLYGWVRGFLGNYMKEGSINIYLGCRIDVGVFICQPPRDVPTMWEIGIFK